MGPGAPSGAGGPSRARGRDPRYDFRGGMIPRQIYGGHFEYIGNAREMGAVPLPGYSWGPQAKPGDVGRYLAAMEEEDRRRAGRRHGGARGPSRAGHPSRGGRPSRGGQKGERGGGNGTRGEGHFGGMDDLEDAMDDMHISGGRGGSRAQAARKGQASGLRRRQQDVRGQRRQHAQHAQQVLQGVRR